MIPLRVRSGDVPLLVATFLVLASGSPSFGQGTEAKRRNLETCLSGQYPILCKHSLLTPDELERVREAERAANLRTCLTGKYPILCRHALLRGSEVEQVREAERRENLKTCRTGKYPILCKHALLTPAERTEVDVAERAENLRTCLTGRYPVLCKRGLLTPDEAQRVAAAEKANATAVRPSGGGASRRRARGGSSDCESGHWIESVSEDGDVVTLGDSSVWQVDPGDEVVAMLWLPTTEVVLCEGTGKLINTDDDESIGVMRAR